MCGALSDQGEGRGKKCYALRFLFFLKGGGCGSEGRAVPKFNTLNGFFHAICLGRGDEQYFGTRRLAGPGQRPGSR